MNECRSRRTGRSRIVCGALMTILGCVTTEPASAQDRDWTFGAKGGWNWARVLVVEPDEPFTTHPEPALSAGAFFSFPLTDSLSISPEALFTRNRFTSDDFDVEARVESRGIEIPVPVRFYMAPDGVRPHLYLGPKLSFLGKSTQIFGNQEQDLDDEIKKFDLGILFGLGLDLRWGAGALTFDLRYSLGLVNLDKSGDGEIKNRSLQILFGYGI